MENKLRSVKENMSINNINYNLILSLTLIFCINVCLLTSSNSATITIINNDGPGEGLNDPAAFAGTPGNNATTVGKPAFSNRFKIL